MALFSKCTFFVLYPVHVADFCVLHSSHVATFLVLLHVALTSCCFFFYVALISSCTFSVLHFFHNAPFSSFCFLVLYTFCVALFRVPHFSFYTIFEQHFFRVVLISCCTFSVFHCFHVVPFVHSFHIALSSCCTLFVLPYFHVTLFFMLNCFPVVPFSCLSFHLAPFLFLPLAALCSCCTFSGIQASNFVNKRLHHRCFPVKIVKFLRTYISKNTCVRLRQKVFSETLSMSKSHNMVILQRMNGLILLSSEAVIQRCSVKHVFLEILQNSQKNICARVSFLTKLQA